MSDGVIFRPLALGDAGWIIHRHGAMIAKEFGWGLAFEALCAQILADFIRQFDPAMEQSWIAEREGEILGSLFLVNAGHGTAKLRLLYVEPAARGLGLATRLLAAAFSFAGEKGYARVTLFTTSDNTSARRIYKKMGMQLINSAPFPLGETMLSGEDWAITL